MKHALILAAALLSGACTTLQEDGGREFEPSWPEEAEAPKPIAGAIFAQGTDVTLWNNVTARNVGDTLTIRLAESTEAEKSSTTTASKSSNAALTGPTIAG
ncbi:MAG: flagellar basal body L-ring protein FlgH, partial [Peristeroidobacter soli]